MDERKIAYYYSLKRSTREAVADSINRRAQGSRTCLAVRGLILAPINEDVTSHADNEFPKFRDEATRQVFTSKWADIRWRFCRKPSHFDLAICEEINGSPVVRALAIGKPSKAKTNLTLHWVERTFSPDYVNKRTLLIILACAEEYARLLGCKRILIKDAVDSKKYDRYGYAPLRRPGVPGNYLVKELTP